MENNETNQMEEKPLSTVDETALLISKANILHGALRFRVRQLEQFCNMTELYIPPIVPANALCDDLKLLVVRLQNTLLRIGETGDYFLDAARTMQEINARCDRFVLSEINGMEE